MAFDKKPSVYSDRSTIGSAEELDAYGVWVKSEPQDLSAGLADVAGFDTEAVPPDFPYADDFDTDFGSMGLPGIDSDDSDESINVSDFGFADEPIDADTSADIADADITDVDDVEIAQDPEVPGRKTEEVSTQLLMKIADELSSIRSELSTLKKEFADIRAESGAGVKADLPDEPLAETPRGGFFDDSEDEELSLTGDELNNILSSSDFSDGMEAAFDPRREADEAALRELSEVPHEDFEPEPEEIDIDFDSLGIDLDSVLEEEAEQAPAEQTPAEEAPEETPIEETPADEEIDIDFDNLGIDLDSMPVEEEAEQTPAEQTPLEEAPVPELSELEELPSIDVDELEHIRLEGATPTTPMPDDVNYLESDPFVLDNTAFEQTPPESPGDESVLDETSDESLLDEELGLIDDNALNESILNESDLNESAFEDTVSSDPALGLTLDESDFDMSLSGFDEEISFDALDDEEQITASASAPDLDASDLSLDLSDAALDETEPVLTEETTVDAIEEEPSLEMSDLDDISFDDDFSLDMEELGAGIDLEDEEDTGFAKDDLDDDDGIAQVIPEGFEIDAEEAAISLDDDLELEAFVDDDEFSIDIGETVQSEPPVAKAPEAAPAAAEIDISEAESEVAAEVAVDAEAEDVADDVSEDLAVSADVEAEASDGTSLGGDALSSDLKSELKNVLSYMDHLLESLPEDKIEEFAKSEYFDTYKKIFKELGLV